MENRNGITVGHLLQLQRDLTDIIRAEVAGARQELRTDIAAARVELREELAQVKAKQDIANGRTSKLEGALARLRIRVDRGTSLIGSMSKTQKAKLAAAVAVILPLFAEAAHRLLPLALTWLLNTGPGAADPPGPVVLPAPPPVVLPAEAVPLPQAPKKP